MNKLTAFTVLVLATLILGLATVQSAHSTSTQTVFIKPDGTIDPSSAPIQRNGETFTLTSDSSSQIIVERDGIVLDGAGYTLNGNGGGVGINMTCSNVTVQNIKIAYWAAGVLGVFDNNTVQNCQVTYCDSAFKIYAPYYVIVSNDIEHNNEGIRLGDTLNFIAGNTIVNNQVGIHIFNPENEIVQNNIEDSSQSAITFETLLSNQTIYHNNFINNNELLTENSRNPTETSQIPLRPWDNNSSGNYWSTYNGTDQNNDGIGDSPYVIDAFPPRASLVTDSVVDQYPLMTPFNISGPVPQIPASLVPQPLQEIISDSNSDQSKALSFLGDVLQVNLNTFKATLTSDTLETSPFGVTTENLYYWLDLTTKTTATADFEFSNNSLTSCQFYSNGQVTALVNNYNSAKQFIQNYFVWTNDSTVGQMVSLLNEAAPQKNITETSGNIDLKIVSTAYSSTFNWSYTYNGADYSGVSLTLSNDGFQTSSQLTFSDNRAIYSVGNTTIAVSQQQAIQTALNYIKTYSYTIYSGNGTAVTVKDLGVNETGVSASLMTTARDTASLYPYWSINVPLNKVYSDGTDGVTVDVWADSGTVFNAQRDFAPTAFPFPLPLPLTTLFGSLNSFLLALIIVAVVIIVVVLVVVVVLVHFLSSETPKKPTA